MPPEICLDKSRRRHAGGRPRKIIPGAIASLAAVWLILFLCFPALADLAAPSNLRIESAGSGGEWAGGDVTLAWDNPDVDLAGCMIFWGHESGSYTDDLDAGYVTSVTFFDLDPETYYFAALAYNNVGDRSAFSNEVSLSPEVVPLPGALWLFGTGLTGLAACRRWRRRPGK